jgi:hypothetical protein
MYPQAKQEIVPLLRELAAGLREGDKGRHMITVHPDPAPASSSFIHDESWLAFNAIQTCIDYDLVYKMVSEDYARKPAKPVVMAEGGYEGVEFGKLQTPLEIPQAGLLVAPCRGIIVTVTITIGARLPRGGHG